MSITLPTWTMDANSWRAVGRHAVSYAGGAVTAAVFVGVINAGQGHELSTDISTIADSVINIIKAVSGIAGILAPILMSHMAAKAASPESQQAAVASRPDRVVVAIDPARPAETAARLATLSEAKAVITNTEVASVTVSDKVIDAAAPRALIKTDVV